MTINPTQIYNAGNAAQWRRIVFGDSDESQTLPGTYTFSGTVNITGSLGVTAADITSGGGAATFGSASSDTGIYSFPSQIGVGVTGTGRFGLQIGSTQTATGGSAAH